MMFAGNLSFVVSPFRVLKVILYYLSDAFGFVARSNTVSVNGTRNRMSASIAYQTHVVEKGLTMPNRRWNFGHAKILPLIQDCNEFIDRFGVNSDEVRGAVGVLKTYLLEHKGAGIDVPAAVADPICRLVERVPFAEPVEQKSMTREEYFSTVNAPFGIFASGRASVRNYSNDPIPLCVIHEAVDIAKTAPSACNRQATRVYVVDGREKIDKLLGFQNGNKGFGHLANKLIVLTTQVASFRGAAERNFGWLDCGIFAMNIMYSLHYLKVGCCPLNAGLSPKAERQVKRICGIPFDETVCLFLSCGYLPERVDLARSERKQTDEIFRLI